MEYRTVTSERALGILQQFLLQNFEDVTDWLLPSTICFSVPFLFIRLNKKITFYDYGYEAEVITTHLKDSNTGILITDYYAKSWSEEQIKILKSKTKCLIHDACLNIPESEMKNIAADLVVYSTGKAKLLDMGYGAFGHLKSGYKLELKTPEDKDAIQTNYEHLDAYWKQVVSGKQAYDKSEIFKNEWITTAGIEAEKYMDVMKEAKPEVLAHKLKINDIYKQYLPEVLMNPNVGNAWRFNIFVSDPKVVIRKLFENKLFASSHYPSVAQLMGYSGDNVKSEFIGRHIVNLFNDHHMSEQKARDVSELISGMVRSEEVKPVNAGFL